MMYHSILYGVLKIYTITENTFLKNSYDIR